MKNLIVISLLVFLGFSAPTVEDVYSSTVSRSVRIGRDVTGQMYPVSRGVRPHDQVEQRRGSAVLTVIIFDKGDRNGCRQYRRLGEVSD